MTAARAAKALFMVQLRQSGRSMALWAALISALSASSVLAYPIVFPDADSRAALAATLAANPALSLVFGPARDLTTADGFAAWRAGSLGAFFSGLMAVLLVIRNSRADEDTGQAELVASGVLARRTRLVGALLVSYTGSLGLGAVCWVLTVAGGGEPRPTLMLAAAFTMAGAVFAGVAAVCAQLASDARTANTLAIAVLGGFFLTRGSIDAIEGPDWAKWLTPFGWLQQTHPSTEDNPWPLLASLCLAAGLAAAGLKLQARRDYGQGIIAPRPGPARGRSMAGIWRLAPRLHRSAALTWTAALTGIGILFGYLATRLGELLAGNPAMAEVVAAGAVDESGLAFGFARTLLHLTALLAAVFGVLTVLRMHEEEAAGRVEPLLAGSVRRAEYLASNGVIAFVGPTLALVLGGSGIGVVAASADDSLISSRDVIWQTLATIPALWVLIGLAFLAVAARPALRVVGWLGVVLTFALTILGPTLDLPERAMNLSPFQHVPSVVASSPDWGGLWWLTCLGVTVITIGFLAFRRRDLSVR